MASYPRTNHSREMAYVSDKNHVIFVALGVPQRLLSLPLTRFALALMLCTSESG
jgi:hypothetical protein